MLSVLVIMTAILSFALFLLRHDRRSLFLSLASISFSIFYFTMIIYIAKKGGISKATTFMLFFSYHFRQKLQFMVLTLQTLGFTMAISKFMFPYFLLLSSLSMAHFKQKIKSSLVSILLSLLPIAFIVIYYPSMFIRLAVNTKLLQMVVTTSKLWIVLYVLASMLISIKEYISIYFSFYKRRAFVKMSMVLSLGLLYVFFIPQDPAQVYLFYKNEYMGSMGLWYLHWGFTSGLYYFMMLGTTVLAIVGIISFMRYFYVTFGEITEVKHLKRMGQDAMRGVSMLVHGTKNDLLSTSILLDSLKEKYPYDNDVTKPIEINNGLKTRLDRLNRASKANTTKLKPHLLSDILEDAKCKVSDQSRVFVQIEDDDMVVLADRIFLAEAIANIVQNGIEAMDTCGCNLPVVVKAFYDRLWIVITIEDRASGISREDAKRIWEPFHTSKNSSTNWGIGMYFAKSIIKNHLGSINFESQIGKGTCFSIVLPRIGGFHVKDLVGRG